MSEYDFYDQVERAILQPMIGWLCAGQPLHIVDAGCGAGAPALMFAELGCTVTGVDVEAAELDAARRLVNRSPFADRLTFLEGDLQTLPFKDRGFDLVWCSYVLHHIADKARLVRGKHPDVINGCISCSYGIKRG